MKVYDYADIPKLPKGQWISVKDALPPIGEEVTVFCPRSERHRVTALVRLIPYEGALEFFWDNAYGGGFTHVQDSVTHWMPMPKEPALQSLASNAKPGPQREFMNTPLPPAIWPPKARK